MLLVICEDNNFIRNNGLLLVRVLVKIPFNKCFSVIKRTQRPLLTSIKPKNHPCMNPNKFIGVIGLLSDKLFRSDDVTQKKTHASVIYIYI